MNEWMPGWMAGWMDGWLDEWMDGWMMCEVTAENIPNLHWVSR
jgi:hypothetical protein